ANKIHRLACRLIRARDPAPLPDVLQTSLRADFGPSECLILLGSDNESQLSNIKSRHRRLVESKPSELTMFVNLFESGCPRFGQIRDSQRDFLLGENTVEIGSAALVPLGPQPHFGLLAIGSPDAERFHPAMSTDFLARIGDLVSEAVGAA